MSIIVRGGQTTLHYFRMTRQVMFTLFKWGFIITVIWGLFSFFTRVSLYDLKIYGIYYLSRFYELLGASKFKLRIKNSNGDEGLYMVSEIVNNSGVITIKSSINEALIQCLISGFKYGILLVVVGLIIFAFKGYILGRKRVIRGQELVSLKTLNKQIRIFNFFKLCFSSAKICQAIYPKNSEYYHTLITGATGTGKTQAIIGLLSQIREKKERCIIYDPTGDLLSLFYDPDKDIILNQFDKRSHNWNLIKDAEDKSFRNLATAFIPVKTTGGDRFWDNAARETLVEAFRYLKSQNKLENKYLKRLLFGEDNTEFQKMIEDSGILNKILSKESNKTTANIISVLITEFSSVRYLEDLEKDFSISEWIHNDRKGSCLFLTSRGDYHENLKPLISAELETAINSMLSLPRSKKQKTWVILDELPSLNYLPSLEYGLAQSRKFGGCFVLSLQLMAQLRASYGRDRAEAISGLCRTRVVFSTPDQETAKWCSQGFGNVKINKVKETFSYGSHKMRDGVNLMQQEEDKAVVTHTEIMNLKNFECFVKVSQGFPATRVVNPLIKLPEIAEHYQEKILNIGEINPKDNAVDPQNQEITVPIILEKQTQENIILDLIESESSKGNLYIPNQFAERFEDQKGLKSKSLVLERISSLSTSGKILYSRDWGYYGLEKISTKLGLMLISGMKYKDKDDQEIETIATHFKHPTTGVLTAIIDQEKEEDFIDEAEGDEDIEIIEEGNNHSEFKF